ncbi:MAG: tRNA uridine-5-carboxymethylaminomethyl(34) synthesis enzyme MnmG [Candidatus Omnitrophica bacterium]|nr:tRNA uridine-5-carboxymethylaminomethyl(34) synthesis enzyme MnmG [Candidatus Omnitrophota bacterium]
MNNYDCIVIGGGHAGVEAALAASRMGCSTLMVTFSFDTIGQMSCNPAIGGVGKGQLVKEIDALGGEMGLAADKTGIQFRQLNASKGQAVRSSRCQSDRKRYKLYMQDRIRDQNGLDVLEDEVNELLVKRGKIVGVKTEKGGKIKCASVVVAAGTFLHGRMHIGKTIIPGGRIEEPNSTRLAENIRDLGFEVLLFKTGTPPRLDGGTIDFSKLQGQYSDERPVPFSFRTPSIPPDQELLPCYITGTNKKTHQIIEENMHLSPMYSGQIQATGVRYCPSIEDKLKKFGGKSSHQVFLEPEGLQGNEYYPNGISTGLPADVQEEMVHSIAGLEHVNINRHGYSIEHGVIPATALRASLQTKKIKSLFLAGQINGTTGYEEAAAQGIMAGINAARSVKNEELFILARDESYIGVLIDDLVTKGTPEPYRMFTSRVEYRLIVREDNADHRMAKYGRQLGLLGEDVYRKVEEKYERIQKEIGHLRSTRVYPGTELDQKLILAKSAPLRQPTLLSDILKRPEVDYAMIAPFDGDLRDLSPQIVSQVEYEIKYEGFINRQLKDIERFRHIEKIRIPDKIDYDIIPSLSIEIRQKLKNFAPANLGQANRISGVTPAAISILMVYLKKFDQSRSRR